MKSDQRGFMIYYCFSVCQCQVGCVERLMFFFLLVLYIVHVLTLLWLAHSACRLLEAANCTADHMYSNKNKKTYLFVTRLCVRGRSCMLISCMFYWASTSERHALRLGPVLWFVLSEAGEQQLTVCEISRQTNKAKWSGTRRKTTSCWGMQSQHAQLSEPAALRIVKRSILF